MDVGLREGGDRTVTAALFMAVVNRLGLVFGDVVEDV